MAYGMTVPFDGVPLADHRSWFARLADLGYTDVWSSEADGTDAFTPLALAAAWSPSLRLGTAIVPAFTRGPGLLAQSVAAMAEAAPGRFVLGLGTSSELIVTGWNDIGFDEPYKRVRDLLRFLPAALTGERIDAQYETFSVKGFRVGRPPVQVPPILVAALRPGMLRLAGRHADGTILNWLAATDVPVAVKEVGPGKEIAARIFVCPSGDADAVRAQGRRLIAAYLNVPVYAAFHDWLGRGPRLQPMWDAWAAGDRRGALAAVPDDVLDELIVHGPAGAVKERIQAYVDNGVTTPVLAILPFGGVDLARAVEDLAPH